MARRGRAASLPLPTTSFVGREQDRAALASVLERERLITVHGPPGVGKTRLAVMAASERAAALDGRAWFCDLADASPRDTVETLSRALGAEAADGDGIESLGAWLATRGDCLVVLDDFEHLVPSGLDAVAALRRAAPRATLLVTSRVRLGLPGEIVFGLSPLALPTSERDAASSDAVRLFVERARAARREFDPSADAGAVVALVRALDGLPLAIELAAARMRVVSAAQLLADEARRQEVLSRRSAGSGDRTETLHDAIDGSWALLPARERTALGELSVFRGGFTLEAAERVLSVGSGVLEVLESLVDRSLVVAHAAQGQSGALRFGLLASIRAYAAERLAAAGNAPAAEARHTAVYLELAAGLRSKVDEHGGLAARRALSAEMENLLAVHSRAVDAPAGSPRAGLDAIEAALAIDAALQARGPHERRVEVISAALTRAASEDVGPAVLAEAYFCRAHARRLRGDVPGALADCDAAAALARDAGHRRLLGRVLGAAGVTLWEQGELESARDRIEQALALHVETKDRDWHAATMNNRGLLALAEGRLSDARAAFDEALRLHRAVGNRRREAMNLNNLAFVDLERGLAAPARAGLAESLALSRELADARTEANATLTLGLIELDAGDLESAAARCREARELALASSDPFLEGQALAQLGMVLAAADRLEEAREALAVAIERLHSTKARGLEGLAWACLAWLEASAGDSRAAHAALESVPAALGDAGYEAAGSLCRAWVELGSATGIERTQRGLALDEMVRRARATRPGTADRRASVWARWIAARLERTVVDAAAPVAAGAVDAVVGVELVIDRDGRWFVPSGGERVGLHRRRPLSRLLKALLDGRLRTPGRVLTVEQLFASGWPGERCAPRSGASRVYNGLATLRKMGLRDVLLSRDDGYLLDPERGIRVAAER